jgi:hypothetical protein
MDSKHEKIEKIRSDDYYELVYQAAQEASDRKELKKKLDELAKANPNFFIDERKMDITGIAFTAASRLAYESIQNSDPENKLADKALWLCELGADYEEAAMGFALAGDKACVALWHKEYEVDPAALVFAYFLGKGKEEGGALAKPYIDKYKISPLIEAGALAFRGAKVELDLLYKELINDGADITELTGQICFNAGRSGRYDLAEDYKNRYTASSGSELASITRKYIQGIAQSGDFEWLDPQLKDTTLPKEDVIAVIKGYAQGGFHEKVKETRQQHHISPDIVAQAYRECRNMGRAKEYDLDALLDSYLKERSEVRDKKTGKTKEYKGLPIGLFQKSFKEKEAAVKALKTVINGGELPAGENLIDHLSTLRNGNLGKALRQYVRGGMADDRFDREVRTVTQFITELQEQINFKKTTGYPE